MHSDQVPTVEDSSSQSSAAVTFIAHAKEYGILYAIAYFIAADVGLLARVAEISGGMC